MGSQQSRSTAASLCTDDDAEQQLHLPDAPTAEAMPEEILLLVFGRLPLRDLLHAAVACSHWNRCLAAVWQPRCLARWQHWEEQPARDAGAAAWREAYVQRHQIDRHTLSLLAHDACWPTKKADAFSSIMAHGADVLDVLTTTANASSQSGLYVGLTHHALIALQLVKGQLAAAAIERVLAADAGAPSAAAAAAVAAPPAQATAEVPDEVGRVTDALQAGAVLTEHGAGGSAEDDVLEVALHLVEALHPMSDVAAVRCIIDRLGEELTRRMAAAGAAPGSRQALVLLNALLFGQPPPAATTAAAVFQQQAGDILRSGSTQTSTHSATSGHSSGSSRGPGGCWSSAWPRNEDLWGPDLSGFVVPTDGHSGLGLKGKPEAYQLAKGSCLDSVLADRTGLPISVAVLHRAVGRRAGLTIHLANAPGCIINRVVLHSAGGGGSSGSTDRVVYVDVFAGTELDEAAFSHLWSTNFARSGLPLTAPADELQRRQLLPDMSARDVCKRMLSNLCHLSMGFLQDRGAVHLRHLYLLLPLLQLASRFASDAFLAWGRVLVAHQELLDFCSMTQLYTQLLDQAGHGEALSEVSTYKYVQQNQHNLAQPSAGRSRFWEGVCANTDGACIGADVVARVSVRPYRELPCIVTWWGQDATRFEQGAARPKDELGVLWAGRAGVVLMDLRSSPVADAFSRCDRGPPGGAQSSLDGISGDAAWFASDGSCQVTQQAFELLRDSWYDPDVSEKLTALLRSNKQQLQDPRFASEDCWELLENLAACSPGLGFWFDAVWYDADLGQCVLVPNSYLRFRFPGS